MELFYRIYDDTSRLATQKIEFEKKMCTLVEERKELLQQQEHIQKQIKGARSELNDQHAFNDQLNSSNMGRENTITAQKKKSDEIFEEIMTLTSKKVNSLKQRQNAPKDAKTKQTALSNNETTLLNRIVKAQ